MALASLLAGEASHPRAVPECTCCSLLHADTCRVCTCGSRPRCGLVCAAATPAPPGLAEAWASTRATFSHRRRRCGPRLCSSCPVHHCDVPSCGVLSCAVQKTEPKSESGAGSGIKLGRFNKDPRDGGGGALLLHVVRHCRCLYARRSSRGVAWRGVAWRYCGLRRAALCALRCPAFSDVDLEKLRDAIQKVCRSTDPLGRSMVRGTAARCCGGDM